MTYDQALKITLGFLLVTLLLLAFVVHFFARCPDNAHSGNTWTSTLSK